MSDHFNQLTPAEAERLAVLLEELGEAQQIIGKILRHGYNSTDPTRADSPTNRDMLTHELADIWVAVDYLKTAGDVREDWIRQFAVAKTERIRRYLHHQDPRHEPCDCEIYQTCARCR